VVDLLRRPGTRRRWGTMAVILAVLAALPALVAALPAHPDRPAVPALLARIRASAGVPYVGYAESSGRLDLPDVGIAEDQARLAGETSRLRVWYAAPDRHRVDGLELATERDLYRDGDDGWEWESGEQRATRVVGFAGTRLPDLAEALPPDLGRRLLRGLPAAAVRVAGAARVARRDTLRLVVDHRDPDSLIRRVRLWADPLTGLVLRVEVEPVTGGPAAFRSSFLDLDLRAPDPRRLVFTPPPDARVRLREGAGPDAPPAYAFPDRLAGLPRRSSTATVTTYGRPLGVVGVLAADPFLAARIRSRLDSPARPPVRGGFGEGTLVLAPLLTLLVVSSADRGYLLFGPVPRGTLERVATELVRTPPAPVFG
jgi:hypothetical protein